MAVLGVAGSVAASSSVPRDDNVRCQADAEVAVAGVEESAAVGEAAQQNTEMAGSQMAESHVIEVQ